MNDLIDGLSYFNQLKSKNNRKQHFTTKEYSIAKFERVAKS